MRIITTILLISIIAGVSGSLCAQDNPLIDSLESELQALSGRAKIDLLGEISREYVGTSPEKTFEYAMQVIDLMAAKDYTIKDTMLLELAGAYGNIGWSYFYQSAYEEAIESFEKSLKKFKKFSSDNPENLNAKNEIVELYNNIGMVYNDISEYTRAKEYYRKALDLGLELNNSEEVANAYVSFGFVEMNLGNYANAIEQYNQALELFEKEGSKDGAASTLNSIGIVYYYWGDYEKTINYFQQAYALQEDIGNKYAVANIINNIGNVYYIWKNYEKALEHYNKSYEFFNELGNKQGLAMTLRNIGIIYNDMEDSDKAIEYYNKSLKISEELKDHSSEAAVLNSIGLIWSGKGNYKMAGKVFQKSLLISEQIGDKRSIGAAAGNLGLVYNYTREYEKALQYLDKSLDLAKEMELIEQLINNYSVYSEVYESMGEYRKALEYHQLYTSLKDSLFNEESQETITEMQTKYETAVKEKEIELQNIDLEKKDAELLRKQAEINQKNTIVFAITIGLVLLLMLLLVIFRSNRQKKKVNRILEQQNFEIKQQKEEIQAQAEQLALTNTELEKLSIAASETDNAIVISTSSGKLEWVNEGFKRLYGFSLDEFVQLYGDEIKDVSANPDAEEIIRECIVTKKSVVYVSQSATRNKGKIWVQTTLTPILDSQGNVMKLIAIDSDISKLKFAEAEIKQQKEEIESQRDEIEAQRDIATEQRDLLTIQKQEITDSIHYALRIQSAILPDNSIFERVFHEYCIINKPKDIVSGDFYWIQEKAGKTIVAVGDCTGHGVPGAFMSIIGCTFLNEIVNIAGIDQPALILDNLRKKVIQFLQQKGEQGEARDGMDISLLSLDIKEATADVETNGEITASFSGAHNPLNIISQGSATQIKADRMPIGYYSARDLSFSDNKLILKKGDVLYMLTDGFVDQFGGDSGKKFKYKTLKEKMVSCSDLPMKEQKNLLEQSLHEWMNFEGKTYEQIDDILILGIRI